MDNIEIIISRFGKDFLFNNDRSEMMYNCPFCEKKRGKKDSDHKLYVSTKLLVFHCFKCNTNGHLSNKKIESTYGVYNKLLEYKNINSTDSDNQEDNMFYIPNIKIPRDSIAYEYCISRGITDEIINFYNIRLGIDNLFGRIVVPNEIYGDNGVWTDMFSARTYLNQTPKYRNPDGCKKSNSVFNIHNIKSGGDIYVNEGAITAIFAGKEAVATYGCHPSSQQIKTILNKNPKNIYCTLDGDEAGRKPNEDLAEVFSREIANDGNVYLVYMPKDKDAADMGEKVYKEYVNDNKILYNSSVYMSVASYLKRKD